ncbi:GntR family transcriptional regulator [Bifidobacterium phasiani]|uniref:GntR family transcriptional regulator n=1 Tax=Bifidobacterium phasiani TaxID=2834431 RepID=A0ABS6WBK6_9BIFI|nr:GntR family transcriptional regulator [Bifidobacterium phasiani]MBW3083117.1 GntR family transcriptional regulator [Bifidobacterium phasiani]
MDFDYSGAEPLFRQVADQLRAGIASGEFPEGGPVPSTTEISRTYAINPATVLKGMNLLVGEGLLEKRRGLGMFVVPGARDALRERERERFVGEGIAAFVAEARRLGIGRDELTVLIEGGYSDGIEGH